MGHATITNLCEIAIEKIHTKASIDDLVATVIERDEKIHASEGSYGKDYPLFGDLVAQIYMDIIDNLHHPQRLKKKLFPIIEPCDMNEKQEDEIDEWQEELILKFLMPLNGNSPNASRKPLPLAYQRLPASGTSEASDHSR